MGTWRSWFGPSKQEIWRQLTGEMEARYVRGGFWKGDKVEATHGSFHTSSITIINYRKVIRIFFYQPELVGS